jgi:hypothetical protein
MRARTTLQRNDAEATRCECIGEMIGEFQGSADAFRWAGGLYHQLGAMADRLAQRARVRLDRGDASADILDELYFIRGEIVDLASAFDRLYQRGTV